MSPREGEGLPLRGQVALVTGAAKRIGRSIALALAREGARVAVHYRSSAEEAEETAARAGRGAKRFRADLTSVEETRLLAGAVAERLGPIEILVNNAAAFGPTPFGETTEAEWDRFHDVNLKGVFFLTQACAAHMESGSIVNIADSAGVTIWPGYLAYSVTKAGVIALTKGLAKALAPDIRVNAVVPGPMLPPVGSGEMEPMARAVSRTLLKREGSPEDVAKVVRFLLTEGEYITGAVIPVDGGRHLRG